MAAPQPPSSASHTDNQINAYFGNWMNNTSVIPSLFTIWSYDLPQGVIDWY